MRSMTDTLKAELNRELSRRTLGQIARASGVAYPVLYRFRSGERGLTLDTAGRLAAELGLGLTRPGRRPAPSRN